MPNWRFRKLKKSELNRGTTEAEFFRGGESTIDSLVRESIQNSLDATDKAIPGPVRVRFFVSGNGGAVPVENAAPWLKDLGPHLKAAKLAGDEDNAQPASFVVIEDFKTLGLCGSTTAARQTELTELEKEFFYFFWRNVGITGKGGIERGSWGLGKLVYPAASDYRAMFGLTVRKTDGKQYLMGLAGLGQHTLGSDDWHDAFGFYGEFEKDPADDDFVLPCEDPEVLTAFRQTFRLKRTNEAGLSVVVPFPRDEEILATGAIEAFACSILHQFAFPLAAGQLTVEVESPSRTIHITRDDLEDVINEIDWSSRTNEKTRIRESIDLARWALDNADQVLSLTRKNEASLGASWEELVIAPEELQAARDRFNSRTPVGFEVPVLVRRRSGERQMSRFQVFLRQRDDLPGAHCAFVRQGLTITEVPGPSGSGLVALVVVEDAPLAELLRAAENPAHTRWNVRADRVKEKFVGGDSRVQVVTSAPRELLRQLLNADATVDRELLADLFPEPSDHGGPIRPGETKGRKKAKGTITPPPAPKPKPLRIDRVDGGFVAAHVANVVRSSDELQVEVAFDCESGNPFKLYEVFDFDLSKSPIKVETQDADVMEVRSNRLTLKVRDGFKLRVTGFDTSRDLILKPRWIPKADAPTEEEAE